MMKDNAKANLISCCYLCWVVLMIAGSTWFLEVVPLSTGVQRIIAVLTYLPFLLLTLYDVFLSVKARSISTIQKVFALLAAYYVGVSAYRFLHGMEVKENLYYFITLCGSVCLYDLIRRKELGDHGSILKNLKWISILIGGYVIVYEVLLKSVFYSSPINYTVLLTLLLMLIPILPLMWNGEKQERIISIATFILSMVITIISGSRTALLLSVFLMPAMIAVCLLSHKHTKKMVLSFVGVLLVVLAMLATDFNDTRYKIDRSTGLDVSSLFGETDDSVNKARMQADRSDNMRADLQEMGMEQIKKSPLFGTGDLLYYYQMNRYSDQMIEKLEFFLPPHNFIIETMVCFGAIGTAILAAFFFLVLKDFFQAKAAKAAKLSASLTLLVYLVEGIVQATAYSILICPLLFIILALVSMMNMEESESIRKT